jgi:hypothetical protein
MPKGHEKEMQKTSYGSAQESIKDSQDVSNVLLILDSHTIRTNPFGANVTGENSYRRAERISAALHLVTNHVPEEEPLRSIIRNKGLELLSVILELRSGFRGPASEKGQSVLVAIRELISLTRLLAVSGYISVQNANAIAEALDELGSLMVVSQRSALAEQLTISHDQLIPPTIQGGFSRLDRAHPIPRSPRRPLSAGEQSVAGSANQRSERIMDILKLGGMLGIRDIAANLPQYSEKMVQRELAELVTAGKVRKVGAKRWSRYQLL